MTFLKFCAFIIALNWLKGLIFGTDKTLDLDIYDFIGKLVGYFIGLCLVYLLFGYCGADVIEFFKSLN
jgi:hypothetical protein|nr:MAG TPA_asm: hypothetical protein [Caudoviricetes sp.]